MSRAGDHDAGQILGRAAGDERRGVAERVHGGRVPAVLLAEQEHRARAGEGLRHARRRRGVDDARRRRAGPTGERGEGAREQRVLVPREAERERQRAAGRAPRAGGADRVLEAGRARERALKTSKPL